jgi:hypothetical protein
MCNICAAARLLLIATMSERTYQEIAAKERAARHKAAERNSLPVAGIPATGAAVVGIDAREREHEASHKANRLAAAADPVNSRPMPEAELIDPPNRRTKPADPEAAAAPRQSRKGEAMNAAQKLRKAVDDGDITPEQLALFLKMLDDRVTALYAVVQHLEVKVKP